MPDQLSYVIIGNGVAGVTAAEILRSEDSAADITVIADDPFPVYYRPALKDYLAGRVREDKLWARPTSFYQDQRIRFLSDRAVGIQAGQHTLQLQSGHQVGYSRLLLANGARASTLKCPGLDLAGVTTLRTVADYQAVQQHLGVARRIVVTGSGTLALESIETLRHRGYPVVHLLRRRTLWSEVLDPTASDLVLQQERRDGVDVRLEEEIAEVTGQNGQVTGIVTTGGARIPCDLVVIAIGIDPIIDFIKSSGIPCGRGVQVDASMRTGAPDVYAAGDLLETADVMTSRTRVLGQWYPAIQQARAAAYSMLDLLDTRRPFRSSTFYNATFLYGLDFASVGLTNIPRDGYQEIVADPRPRVYRKALLKDGVPVGILALGDRKGTLAFKRAIDHRVNLSSVASRLFADDFKLNEWLDKQGVPPAILSVSREGAMAVVGATLAELPAGQPALATVVKPQPEIEAFFMPAQPGSPMQLSQTRVMTIGRQAGVHLLIDHSSVSRRHAEISYANGKYTLRDLGSSNGTFVNDKRLEQDSVSILKNDDRIRFGKVAYVFQVRTPAMNQGATGQGKAAGATAMKTLHHATTGFFDPAALSAGQASSGPHGQPMLNADGSLLLPGATTAIPAAAVASFEKSPALITLTGGKPEVFHLKPGKSLMLGRDKKNDIVLADIAASRKHAEIFFGLEGVYIRDFGTNNGVMINSTRIDNPYRLVHGDRITIGSIVIYFMEPGGEIENVGSAVAAGTGSTSLPVNGGGGIAPLVGEHPLAGGMARQQNVCPSCGTSNIPTARFCANCGTPLKNT